MVVIFVIVFVCLRNHKREKIPLKVDDTRCLEDSMTQTNQDFETKFNDSVHKASSVNSERLKESMSASSIPVLESDGIYSNADEVENVVSASCSNIQCLENSAYQEIKYDREVNSIKCLENSAYGDIKHGVGNIIYSVPH